MKYPVIQQPTPWDNLRELGIEITVDGVVMPAVISQDSIPGDIYIGSAGFEASNPYVIVSDEYIQALGDLHGKTVVIGTDNYIVRNVRPKPNIALTRLVLDAR